MAKKNSENSGKNRRAWSRRAFLVGPLCPEPKVFKGLLEGLQASTEDLVVGIDEGCLHWGIQERELDLAVGDWDSLREVLGEARLKAFLNDVPNLTLPEEKDRSDLAYAAAAAVSAGADELVCFGITGGRFDHELAAILDLAALAAHSTGRKIRRISIVDPTRISFIVGPQMGKLAIGTFEGQLISTFSLAGAAAGVTLKGVVYPLKNTKLPSSSLGLSNIAKGERVEVSVVKGSLLVVLPGEDSA